MGMQIKKYQAPTLQKALELIRAELGDGAIILQADPVKAGLLGRHGVEVTAAIDRKTLGPRIDFKVDEAGVERTASSQPAKPNKSWSGLFSKNSNKTKEAGHAPKPQAAKPEAVKDFVKKAAEEPVNPSMGQLYAMKTFVEPIKKEVDALKAQMASTASAPKVKERAPSSAFLESEIQGLKATLQSFIHEQKMKEGDWSLDLRKLENFWREKGMTSTQIAHFFAELQTQGSQFQLGEIQTTLNKKILAAKTFDSRAKKIVVLVGPTGVGKTTSIAKLAAFEKLKLGRRVCLVTLDDYKIGGTDQLGHYARILEVPFVKCRSDIPLEDQIKTLDCDTVFVDTFGTSPRDDAKIAKLRKNLQFKDANLQRQQELHLVLPVGLNSGDVDIYLQSFERMNPNYLLFTKWDETNNWGGMLAAILSSTRPVSFVGHGQEVPDDISVFDSKNFIDTVINTEN